MSGEGDAPRQRRWPQATRWAICFAAALLFHGVGAAALLARWNDDSDLMPNEAVVMVDMAPEAVAQTTTPSDAPPAPVESKEQIEPEPQPEKPVEKTEIEPEPVKPPEKVEIKPDNSPTPELSVMPPPKPVEKPKEKKEKPKHKMASIAQAPSAAEKLAARAAAPAAGANSHNPNAVPSWMSQIVSRIQSVKRSVTVEEIRIATVNFTVDRSGGVHDARIVRSSGSSALDEATLALVSRASPLPPPPPEKPGERIPISLPVRYTPSR
jgi:periplasmic protein TonB